MIILGLYNGHNAAACVMKDGQILINWELERFSRIKHDYGFNQAFLDKTLEHCRLTFDDIDLIITNSQDFKRPPPWKVPSTAVNYLQNFMINNKQAYALNHHLAHVASAYYTSPFSEATIITQDGGGDDENFSYGTAQDNHITGFTSGRVRNIAAYWSGITLNNYRMPRLHAWDPGSGAGKIMALAAYGNTNDELETRLEHTMEQGIQSHYTDPHSRAFNNDEDLSDVMQQRSMDVAAALQSYTEKEVKNIYDQVHAKEPNDNLCLAGGIALNCVANTRVKSKFKNIHVPPFPNDTGLAIGMVLYAHHQINGAQKVNTYFSPYLGPEYNGISVSSALYNCGLKHSELDLDFLVDYLCERKPIVMCRGRSESGPRALGNRSIMCVPDMENGRDLLNFKIKQREWYRPYAPIILDKYVDDILEDYLPESPYMSTSGTIKEEWRSRMSAVNHVDNSTRPQILKNEHNPFMYYLIERIYARTGIPVLLNTSFNKQEPIVETPEEAINTFKQFENIGLMVLHNMQVIK